MQTNSANDILFAVLQFLYTIAHWLGERIVSIVKMIIPQTVMLDQLVDPIGLLGILTIFLIIAQIAKKIAWIIVITGWILILVRVILLVIGGNNGV